MEADSSADKPQAEEPLWQGLPDDDETIVVDPDLLKKLRDEKAGNTSSVAADLSDDETVIISPELLHRPSISEETSSKSAQSLEQLLNARREAATEVARLDRIGDYASARKGLSEWRRLDSQIRERRND